MSDVARLAGVNSSTVSRALNDRTAAMLRPETVAKVRAASAQLGYRPNMLARGLRTQRTDIIGLILPDVTNPFFPPIVRGIEDVLTPAGYVLLIANTDNVAEREDHCLESLMARQIDGLMLATSHLEVASEPGRLIGLPVLLVNRRDRSGSVPAVVPDDAVGVRLVVEHLRELGHREIALVSGPLNTSTGRDRRAAFVMACTELGLPTDMIVHADRYDRASGHRATEVLLDAHGERPTAVFASNDLLAVGALTAIRGRGRRIPQDVSLAGYNDMPLVDLLDPPLTTVRIDQYEMGRRAGMMMLRMLQDDRTSRGAVPVEGTNGGRMQPDVVVRPELVVRSSTAAPAAPAR